MNTTLNKLKNRLTNLNFPQLVLIMVSIILFVILINLFFRKSINESNINNTKILTQNTATKDSINNLDQNVSSIGSNEYSLKGNLIYINNGKAVYTVYDYHPTDLEIRKLASFFKVSPDNFIIQGDEFQKTIDKKQQIENSNLNDHNPLDLPNPSLK